MKVPLDAKYMRAQAVPHVDFSGFKSHVHASLGSEVIAPSELQKPATAVLAAVTTPREGGGILPVGLPPRCRSLP